MGRQEGARKVAEMGKNKRVPVGTEAGGRKEAKP